MSITIIDNRKHTRDIIFEDEKDLLKELKRFEDGLEHYEHEHDFGEVKLYENRIKKIKLHLELYKSGAVVFPIKISNIDFVNSN